MPVIENLVNKTEWSSLTGLILDGGYEMKEPLELEQASALFKIRVLGGWGQEAFVRLYHADLAQLSRFGEDGHACSPVASRR